MLKLFLNELFWTEGSFASLASTADKLCVSLSGGLLYSGAVMGMNV